MKTVRKVLYFSSPIYLDYDLSLIKNLSDLVDIYYFLDISPITTKETVLKLEKYNVNHEILDGKSYNLTELFGSYLPDGKTFIINRSTHKPALSNIKLLIKIIRYIRRIRPDIVHFNIDFNHNYFLLYFISGVKYIWTIHDPLPHSDDDTFKENLKRRIFYRLIKNYILLNDDQRTEFIRKYNMGNKNIFISKLGIYDYLHSIRPFPQVIRERSTLDNIKILFFGRITKSKGLIYLLKAYHSVKSRNPGASLTIAGKGYIPDYGDEIVQNVTFINRYIENEELADMINDSDLVVCPYIDGTQSGVIMTAFAFCKPVIATHVGGFNNYVEDEVTGLLIKPKSVDEIEKAIEKFINSPGLLLRISENIRNRYHCGSGSWKSIAENTVNIYDRSV